jgi:hypothetical protein
MTTVRSLVRDIQAEVLETADMTPDRAAELLMKLTALFGNCNAEIRTADAEYAVVLLGAMQTEDAASRAKIRAETSPEYMRKREARDTKELVKELSGGLKYYLRSVAEEMRLTR